MPEPTIPAASRQKGRKVELFQKLLGVKDHEGNRIETQELKQLYKKTLAIAWPSTMEGALISIISSVDTMMVGTLGAASIAAVGLTAQPRRRCASAPPRCAPAGRALATTPRPTPVCTSRCR